MTPLQRAAAVVNKAVGPFVRSPQGSRIIGRWMTLVTYTGRRSGNTYSLPVAYRRSGDTVTVGVTLPDQKKWWRNFLGTGGPILLRLGGTDRPGHAVAHRSPSGAVSVDVELDASAA